MTYPLGPACRPGAIVAISLGVAGGWPSSALVAPLNHSIKDPGDEVVLQRRMTVWLSSLMAGVDMAVNIEVCCCEMIAVLWMSWLRWED